MIRPIKVLFGSGRIDLGFEIQDWPILNLPKFSQLAWWHGVRILIDAPIPIPMDLVPSA